MPGHELRGLQGETGRPGCARPSQGELVLSWVWWGHRGLQASVRGDRGWPGAMTGPSTPTGSWWQREETWAPGRSWAVESAEGTGNGASRASGIGPELLRGWQKMERTPGKVSGGNFKNSCFHFIFAPSRSRVGLLRVTFHGFEHTCGLTWLPLWPGSGTVPCPPHCPRHPRSVAQRAWLKVPCGESRDT